MKDLKDLFGTDGIRGVVEAKTMDMANDIVNKLSAVIKECNNL